MTELHQLLLGCGNQRKKIVIPPGGSPEWNNLLTVDDDKNCKPDFEFDLNFTYWSIFSDNSFSEVHAYEILEHLGQQGDISSFFATFNNIWRILKPGGFLCATTPSRFSPWLWGDPGHRRAILPQSLIFLDQTAYEQVGHTAMSDYRSIYKSDFKIISSTDDKTFHTFILQAIKPARIS